MSKLLWEAMEAHVLHVPSHPTHFLPGLPSLCSHTVGSQSTPPSLPWLSAHFVRSSVILALCHLPSPTDSSKSSSNPTSGSELQDGQREPGEGPEVTFPAGFLTLSGHVHFTWPLVGPGSQLAPALRIKVSGSVQQRWQRWPGMVAFLDPQLTLSNAHLSICQTTPDKWNNLCYLLCHCLQSFHALLV